MLTTLFTQIIVLVAAHFRFAEIYGSRQLILSTYLLSNVAQLSNKHHLLVLHYLSLLEFIEVKVFRGLA